MENQEIDGLKAYFDKANLPDRVTLYPGTTIVDLPLFVKAQFGVLQSANSSIVKGPAFDRLVLLREIISKGYV